MQEKKPPNGTSNPESQNTLEQTTTYHIDDRLFIVQSVFKENGNNTLGAILLRLMQSEVEKN